MNEDTFNIEVRTFLKQVGVSSQREIEHAVLKAIESGKLKGTEIFELKMTLEIPVLEMGFIVNGTIALE